MNIFKKIEKEAKHVNKEIVDTVEDLGEYAKEVADGLIEAKKRKIERGSGIHDGDYKQ